MADRARRKRLPLPSNLGGDDVGTLAFRVQEFMYGHRFIQEQEPYMIVLELLSICRSAPLGTVPASDDIHEEITYEARQHRKLRFLVFQDRHLDRIAQDDAIPLSSKWSAWKEAANEQYGRDPDAGALDHFAYLDGPLDCDFDALLQGVRLLRSLEIDVMHSRRWTSQFLAVTGPDLLLHDFIAKGPKWTADRRFFGRGGELIYLMLNRSRQAQRLGGLIQDRLLSPGDPLNRLAATLSDPADGSSSVPMGYLPYADHDAFDRMAEDWLAVLGTERLPNGHLFDPLTRLTGLNLFRYVAEMSAEIRGPCVKVEPILLDLQDGRDRRIMETSKSYYERHRKAAEVAVRAHVMAEVDEIPGWSAIVSSGHAVGARGALAKHFSWRMKEVEEGLPPEALVERLVLEANTRSKNNLSTYLPPVAKHIGLALARQKVGTWFAPSDAFLTALVLGNVTDTALEIGEFTERLYRRYGIVIGPREARLEFSRPPCDVGSFEANLAELERRLTGLGLTQRLSDDCAFVENPYRTHHEPDRTPEPA